MPRPLKVGRRAWARLRRRERFDHGEPIAKIDMRPMVIIATCLAAFTAILPKGPTHAVVIELWDGNGAHPLIAGSGDRRFETSAVVTRLALSSVGEILWNDEPVDQRQLITLLVETQESTPQTIVEFEPDPFASYDFSAKVLQILVSSGAPFRITGMEKYCEFRSSRFAQRGSASSLGIALSLTPLPSDEQLRELTQRFQGCEPRAVDHRPD